MNILLILTDQQRFDTLGCYRAPGVHTPNLDRLAATPGATRFEYCYVPNTICTPCRASLWTGRHIVEHGVHHVYDQLDDSHVLFPTHLRNAGYETALFGKLHVSGHTYERKARHPHDGFDIYRWQPGPGHDLTGPFAAYGNWLKANHPDLHARIEGGIDDTEPIPYEAHLTTWASEETQQFLRTRADSSPPFFCCMSVFDPHNPYGNQPRRFNEMIDREKLPAQVAPDEPFDHRPIAHQLEHDHNHYTGGGTHDYQHLTAAREHYHAAVTHIDHEVGRVLETLDQAGLADDTIVIFTSDHGDMLGDHNLAVKGGFFYDACTRVPMIVRDPRRAEQPHVSNRMVQVHDIAATCMRIAGIDTNETQTHMPDARNLLDDDSLASRDYAVCDFRNSSAAVGFPDKRHDPPILGSMWREGKWKLNLYHNVEDTDHPAGELYDMYADPNELTNLWRDPAHATTRERLSKQLTDWLTAREKVNGC